jgi:hypothetical protein
MRGVVCVDGVARRCSIRRGVTRSRDGKRFRGRLRAPSRGAPCVKTSMLVRLKQTSTQLTAKDYVNSGDKVDNPVANRVWIDIGAAPLK